MNPFDSSLFTAPSCLPCCTPAPADCSCALLIPPLASPYADYATAETAVDPASFIVADCLAYNERDITDKTSYSASFDGTTLTIDGTWSSPVFGFLNFFSFSAKSGATISFNSTAGDLADWAIYKCDGTAIDGARGATMPITSDPLPDDGEYFAFFDPKDSGGVTGFTSATLTMTSSDVWTINPVIALWDDSGTTRSLWACPKLLLPPLTESTGDWYADATAAATAISTLTNGCKGYIESTTNVSSFSASGTTSLTLAETLTAGAMSCPTVWGGINAVDAATITSTITVGAGTAGQTVTIYDDTGTQVETSGATTSPWTSAALPYTGRYTVKIAMTSSGNTTSMSAAITSSGTMSVNTVQARYDLGLVCAATDDC